MSDPYYKLLAGWAAGVEYGNWVSNSANPLTGFATSASVVTSETVLGPVDVGSQSYLLLDATGGSLHSAHESIAINSGQQYSFTSYAQKHASYAGEVAVQYWEAGPKFVGFNINSGSVLFNTGTGTPYYKNRGGGWGRFGVTWTPASIGAAQDIGIATIGSGQNITYTQAGGDPRGAYFAGPKLEAGPVSDYRATTGTPENGSLSVVQSLGQVADEDVYIMRVKRQTADILRRLTVGDATLTIDSTRGQYVQSMQINQGVVVKAVTTANSEYALFTGKVKSWNATPALGRQELSVKCIDAADELKQKINLALAVNTKISSLMINVLDAAGFGSDRRDIGVMNDDVSVGYLDNISAGQALHEIIQSGAHFLWIDGDGKVRAEPRHYDVRGAAAVESMSTFLSYGASYSDKKIINRMNVVGSPRREATDIGTVAWIEEAILIPASQSVTFQVEHVDPDTLAKGTPVNSFATLVASSDYYMSAQSGFKGANLTAQASLTITHYATTTEVTALNTSSFSAYLGRFQLRGSPLQLLPAIQVDVDVASSQAVYGLKNKKVENDLIPSYFRARDFADFLTLRYHNPPQDITVGRKNVFPEVVQRDLLDAVHITNTETSVASTFNVTGVEHVISFRRGLEHSNILTVELAFEKDWLILDDPVFGTLDNRRLGA